MALLFLSGSGVANHRVNTGVVDGSLVVQAGDSDASPRAGIGRKAMSDPQIDSETI